MKHKIQVCFQRVVMAILVMTFLLSTEKPLLANPQQQPAQSDTRNKAADPPEAPQPQPDNTIQQETQTPSTAAGAKAASPKGAPVAEPVGAAVAPAKQHSHRSLLIKIGLIAGAGVAVGTVVALSAGSPSRPPGTSPATRP
jgi:hypothetical protein